MVNYIRQLWKHLVNEDLTLIAAALAYSTVLSLIPFIAVTMSTLNYIDALDSITPKVEAFLLENFAGTAGTEGVQLMHKGLRRIQNGRMGSLGAIILVLISTRMMVGLERAFNRIWQIKNHRPLAKRLFYHWLFLLIFPFALALWVAIWAQVEAGDPKGLSFRPGYFITFAFLFVLQKWMPSTRVATVPALIGTTVSVFLLFLLGKIFKLLTVQVFSYGKVYGSFASIPASLLWIFLVWMVILWGVAITAASQKGTE